MKTIPLTQGKFALVDDEDYDELNQYHWCAYIDPKNEKWYAKRNTKTSDGKQLQIRMHRQLMIFPSEDVDHINGNGLDNRRCNLRCCSHSNNSKNRRRQKNNTSGLMGVSWDKKSLKWRGRIRKNQKLIHIGFFNDKNDAGRAVDKKAIELFGEFAVLNFPVIK